MQFSVKFFFFFISAAFSYHWIPTQSWQSKEIQIKTSQLLQLRELNIDKEQWRTSGDLSSGMSTLLSGNL